MYDDYSGSKASGFLKGFSQIPPAVRAAILFAIPFIVVDFFNYYSAGAAMAISLPILALLYAGCGALAAKFAADHGRVGGQLALNGLYAGLCLWLVSTVVNTIIGLILGTASLGLTLIGTIPYLCLCAPVQLVGGGAMGALGGVILGLLYKGGKPSDGSSSTGSPDYYG